jgi:UDP-2,3-diacylglucosamine pyrophosphatase LpxH
MLERSAQLAKPAYIEKVGKALDKVYDPPRGWLARRRAKGRNLVEAAELKDLKIVVMSDLHRGMGDKADDFRRSHRAYRAALGWYVEHGYALWLLGDVEELWEDGPEQVICHYKDVLKLEREFIGRGGLRRFYGNHDLDWSKPKTVREYLGHWIGDTPIIESLRLEVTDDGKPLGTLFFVHGHQGAPGSDVFAPISRLAVRVVWRAVQRSQGWIATTPADSAEIRHKHDAAMFEWAKSRAQRDPAHKRPLLIAGHTHHPVFPHPPPELPSDQQITDLMLAVEAGTDTETKAELRAELNLAESIRSEPPFYPPSNTPPCYFNTGCCSFPDADITCIEITDEIRLVRWLDNEGNPRPHPFEPRTLSDLFAEVNAF